VQGTGIKNSVYSLERCDLNGDKFTVQPGLSTIIKMSNKRKSLGSWFPSASVIKSIAYKDTDKITICLFYQYIRPLWTEERKAQAIKYIEDNAEKLNIGGRVRVGTEGLNSTISSTHANVVAFTKKLAEFDDHFNSTDFKFITDLPLDRAFKDLKVLPVKELVFYGIHAHEEFASGGETELFLYSTGTTIFVLRSFVITHRSF